MYKITINNEHPEFSEQWGKNHLTKKSAIFASHNLRHKLRKPFWQTYFPQVFIKIETTKK